MDGKVVCLKVFVLHGNHEHASVFRRDVKSQFQCPFFYLTKTFSYSAASLVLLV